MLTEYEGYDYVANPLNNEAVELLRLIGGGDSRRAAAYLSNVGSAATVGFAIFVLVGWFNTPETWREVAGENEFIGIILCVLLLVTAGVFWKAVRLGDELLQVAKFSKLMRQRQAIKLPRTLSSMINQRLDEAKLTEFTRQTYRATSRDFDILLEVADAKQSGVVTDDFTQQHIAPLLDELIVRITASYQDTQARHAGRLEGLQHERPPEAKG